MAAAIDGLISGRYRLGELLGTGGSASVFVAVDTGVTADSDSGTVALKILHPHLSRSEQAREAFFGEARAAAVLRHPNIVAVLGVGVHDADQESLAWIALDLAPGLSLAEHVEKHGALEVGDALTVAAGVLLALDIAHRSGLIHRDVSPANVMVEPAVDGGIRVAGVRLLDFGLADAAGRPVLGADVLRSPPGQGPTREVGVLGSANYMSPEQAQGNTVDERGDIYQLGGVLHFALTGRPPFPRDSTSAVMRAHVQSPPPVPSVLRRGIQRGVDRIVVKAMLKDQASRYQSAAEMGEAIADVRLAGNRGDEQTRVLVADLTTVLARSSILASVARPAGTQGSAAQSAGSRQPRAGRQHGLGQAGRWVAGLLAVGVMAMAWAMASPGSTQSSVVETSAPPVAAGAGPTAEPTPREAPTESVRVPELTSMMLAEARAALEGAGLRLGGISTQDSVRVGDTVLGLMPAPGAWVPVGDTVDLVVASGSNRVPPVAGLPTGEGIAALQSAGFVAVTVSRESGLSPSDTVLSSAPGEGAVHRLGTSVTITVSISPAPPPSPAPAPTSTPAAPTSSPSPTPTPPDP